jgi:hypothetical protein
MAYDFQVAVDCADPHALASWSADALGWQVEQQGPHTWVTLADPEGNEFCIS